MEEINKRGLTKKNLKRLFSFGKEDIFWAVFIILLLVAVYAYMDDTRLCRETLSDPYYQKCALYARAEKTAEALRAEYPGVQVICYPETGQCEISGVARMPGMPTKEDLDALNISGMIINISE